MKHIGGYVCDSVLLDQGDYIWHRGHSQSDKTPVLIKLASKQELSDSDFEHEFRILNSLRHHEVALIRDPGHPALVMEDPGGVLFSDYLQHSVPPVEEFLEICLSLVKNLQALHGLNIIHTHLNPDLMLYDPQGRTVSIFDYKHASHLTSEKYISREYHRLINIEYMSPEQSGRIQLSLDLRSDIYSLGILFYRIITGRLPFTSNNVLELLHLHLAKPATPPVQINREIPPIISDIILKMMNKSPEDRYQTYSGLYYDISLCYKQWVSKKQIMLTSLGRKDIRNDLRLLDRIYGRNKQLDRLQDIYHHIQSGGCGASLIAGDPGIGKSALIVESIMNFKDPDLIFVNGKYESGNQNIPYSAIIQSLGKYVKTLLSDEEGRIQFWKEEFLSQAGENAWMLCELIPELNHVIGLHNKKEILSPQENKNRFHYTLTRFIDSICRSNQGVILVLDDVHWADQASMEYLTYLMRDNMPHFGLVMTSRYITPDLEKLLDMMKSRISNFSYMELKPLNEFHIGTILEELFSRASDDYNDLAHIIMNKTGGNPFFVQSFLQNLYRKGLLNFKDKWHWDQEAIKQEELTDNMNELLIARIQDLSEKEKHILNVMACFGLETPVVLLETYLGKSENYIMDHLSGVLEDGMVMIYDKKLRFAHDSIREAIYQNLDNKESMHTSWGHFLLDHYRDERTAHLFVILQHVNMGIEYEKDTQLRRDVLYLNFEAAKQARSSSAYPIAREFLEKCALLFEENLWEEEYGFSLNLYTLMGEIAYLSGDYDRAELHFGTVLSRAHSILDKIRVYELRIILYTVDNQMTQALELSRQALSILGIRIPVRGSKPALLWNIIRIRLLQGRRAPGDLLKLPDMDDPILLAGARILIHATVPSYISQPDLMPILVLTLVSLSMKHGNTAYSSYAYSMYGLISAMGLGKIRKGYEFGKLALKILEKYQSQQLKSKTYFVFGNLISHWVDNVRNDLDYLLDAYHSGFETGDLTFASYSINHIVAHSLFLGENLEKAGQNAERYQQVITRFNQRDAIYAFNLWYQLIELLQKKSLTHPTLIKGKIFDETRILEEWHKTSNYTDLGFYTVAKQILCYLFEDYKTLLEISKQGRKFLDSMMGMIYVPEYHFYYTLGVLQSGSWEQKENRKVVTQGLKLFKKWSGFAPANYKHKYLLLHAEWCRIHHRYVEAMSFYQSSVRLARQNGFKLDEAVINEICSRFYYSLGNERVALMYAQEAFDTFQKWGAYAKSSLLLKQIPGIQYASQQNTSGSPVPREKTIPLKISEPVDANSLDIHSVYHTSQAIGSEIVMSKLLSKLIQILMQSAGAERVLMIKSDKEHLSLLAEGKVDASSITLFQNKVLTPDILPLTLVRYVLRTREKLVLKDARHREEYRNDPYIINHRSLSILVWPLIHHGRMIGIIYMENHLNQDVFNEKRLELFDILIGQITSSFENAILFERLEDYNKNLEQKVTNRTRDLNKAHMELQQQHVRVLKDLDMARRVQLSLIPHTEDMPHNLHIDAAGWYSAMEDVGGDLFDYIQLSDHEYAFFIADVSGHGVPAALITSMAKAAFRSYSSRFKQPGAVLNAMNKDMLLFIGDLTYYLTACYGIIDVRESKLFYSNAGHLPGMHYHADTASLSYLEKGGPILGAFPYDEYPEETVDLRAGDGIMLFTDGITETRNNEGELYGESRLEQFFVKWGHQSATECVETLKEELEEFREDHKIYDDRAMILVKIKK